MNRTEPRPPPGVPPCPDWLNDDAKAAWADLAPSLAAIGLFTVVDGNAFARYCQLWSRWRQAERFIQQYGTSFPLKDNKGRVKCFMPFPEVGVARSLSRELTRLESEFGMTPSGRSRITVPLPATPADPERQRLVEQFFTPPMRLSARRA